MTILDGKKISNDIKNEIAEEVQDEFEAISGVSNTALFGGREREIHVTYDPQVLHAYGLMVSDLTARIRAGHTPVPAGKLNTSKFDFQMVCFSNVFLN